MLSEGHRSFFRTADAPCAPPLGMSAGWTSLDDVLKRTGQAEFACRPSLVMVMNVRIEELAEGCASLRDLAVTDEAGEYKSAEHLSRMVSIATQLPGDVPTKKKKLSPTYDTPNGQQPRSMILLEVLYTATGNLVAGVRILRLVFQEAMSPTYFLSVCMQKHLDDKQANERRTRPLPVSYDPRFAFSRLCSEAELCETLGVVFEGEETAQGELDQYARAHPHAAHITLHAALSAERRHPLDHLLHAFSPELLLRFGRASLIARTKTTTCARQLNPSSYTSKLADGTPSFVPPSLKYTFVFAGQEGAVGCPFPPRLLAEIARTHKQMEPGMSYSAYHFAGPPAPKRARTTDRADTASSTTSVSTDS